MFFLAVAFPRHFLYFDLIFDFSLFLPHPLYLPNLKKVEIEATPHGSKEVDVERSKSST